jgi:CheY-like chemotaxis protein
MSSCQSYRILIVDDLEDNLFLLQTVLESEGYEVDIANSGQLALTKLQTTPYDLVLLDVMMPDMNGFEVTRRVRQSYQLSTLPILLITAHDQNTIDQGLGLGANGFVNKPVDFDKLLFKIERTLASKSNPKYRQSLARVS